jgi:hypothetical protein
MTALLAGIDISTKELTAALIPLDADHGDTACPPVVFRAELLPQTHDDGVFYRDLRTAVSFLVSGRDVQLVYVEKPRGPYAVRQLNAVYGAVMAAIPVGIARAGIEPQEWRIELGLPRNLKKPAAIEAATDWLAPRSSLDGGQTWTPMKLNYSITEHQAEALLVALAARQLNNGHFRSAA